MRGAWGEAKLHRVVEAADLLPPMDFDEQVLTADRLRPDMVVNLPGSKPIVIDSKVPLGAYLRSQDLSPAAGPKAATRHAERPAAHAKALRAPLDAQGSKKYREAVGDSPELVVCFLPAESFLTEALASAATLLDHAFSKNVALASPATPAGDVQGAGLRPAPETAHR